MTKLLLRLRFIFIMFSGTFLFINTTICFGQNSNDAYIANYTEVITKNPNDDDAYTRRAYYYFNKTEYENAGNDCKKALNINPKNYNALFLVAQIFLLKKDFTAVYQFANEAIKNNPQKETNFYLLRGYGYEGANDFKKAKADYETVLALSPENKEAKERLAIVSPKLIEQETANQKTLNENLQKELADVKIVENILNYRNEESEQIIKKIGDNITDIKKKSNGEKITTAINRDHLKTEKATLKKTTLDYIKIWDERIAKFPKGLKGQAANYELQAILKRTEIINQWTELTGEDIFK